MRKRIFILSPANMSGVRAAMVMDPEAGFDVARRLREGQASIGEVFAFISGLYFRGKLAYARRFANAPAGAPYAVLVAAGRGLLLPEHPVTVQELISIASAPVDLAVGPYRETLERDALELAAKSGPDCDLILLGSIATEKYVAPLTNAFGERLLFPAEFAGRGDMSRGGLMLRCTKSGEELSYVAVTRGVRHGARPPRLTPLRARE